MSLPWWVHLNSRSAWDFPDWARDWPFTSHSTCKWSKQLHCGCGVDSENPSSPGEAPFPRWIPIWSGAPRKARCHLPGAWGSARSSVMTGSDFLKSEEIHAILFPSHFCDWDHVLLPVSVGVWQFQCPCKCLWVLGCSFSPGAWALSGVHSLCFPLDFYFPLLLISGNTLFILKPLSEGGLVLRTSFL